MKLLIDKSVTAGVMLVLFLIMTPAMLSARGEGEASGPIEIEWWHAMGGRLGEKVEAIAAGFNDTQDDWILTPVYKGNYEETMTAGIAAFRADNPPHILQVFEVGTASMMSAAGAIVPVKELMERAGEPFDQANFIQPVISYYTAPNGDMLSMPFNSSTPVLFYNKEAFAQAGLDPNRPPQTWAEVADYSRTLVDAGYQAGFSTAWISWIHLENLSAWHDLPIGTMQNGFEGTDTNLILNDSLRARHLQSLADWSDENVFVYGGRRNEGNARFAGGEVAMYTESSAGYAGFKNAAEFEFGVASLPYWDDVDGAPQNTIIGGASLWVLSGHEDAEYAGVARFFTYLSSPEVQADWHQFTGYLPITQAAYDLSQQQGFYEENPGTDIAIKQMLLNDPTENSGGLRFGNWVQVRGIIYEEIEAMFNGQQEATDTLDKIVSRGDAQLRAFEATVSN